MKMVREQNVSMQFDLVTGKRAHERFDKALAICIAGKDSFPAVPPCGDMVNGVLKLDA
jgi:hypothetical protein